MDKAGAAATAFARHGSNDIRYADLAAENNAPVPAIELQMSSFYSVVFVFFLVSIPKLCLISNSRLLRMYVGTAPRQQAVSFCIQMCCAKELWLGQMQFSSLVFFHVLQAE